MLSLSSDYVIYNYFLIKCGFDILNNISTNIKSKTIVMNANKHIKNSTLYFNFNKNKN